MSVATRKGGRPSRRLNSVNACRSASFDGGGTVRGHKRIDVAVGPHEGRLALLPPGPILPDRSEQPPLGPPGASRCWARHLGYNSRNAVATGNLAARTAGNSPPTSPIRAE